MNEDGSCFDDLAALVADFDGLSTDARYAYRSANATAIAGSSSSRLLVVAGPGSGKTHLFLARMAFWLPQDESRRVYVATFVRKLVNDLRAEVQAKLNRPGIDGGSGLPRVSRSRWVWILRPRHVG